MRGQMRLSLLGFPFLAALSGPVGVVFGAAPQTGTPMLVVIPPWRDAGAIVQAAGGWIIAPRAAPFAVLAAADGNDFPDSLRAGGAWWVMSGDAFASICGAS